MNSATLAVRDMSLRLLLPVALLLWWELAARNGQAPRYLPAPSIVANTLWGMAYGGDLWRHVQASLYRGYSGFAIGACAGLLVGLAAGLSRWVRGFFEPIVAIVYPIPKVAFLPLIIIWFGLGHSSKIVIVSVSVFFPVFLAAYYSVRSVNQTFLWSARSMGAGPVRSFLQVLLPAALPEIFSGLRVGLALSFIVLFASELMGSSSGLGYLIVLGEDNVRFDIMLAGIVTIGLLGFISDRILLAARSHLLRGQLIGKESAQ
jgi:ABC-type nitrate/sulfonate/bicarbonate transport system permease component